MDFGDEAELPVRSINQRLKHPSVDAQVLRIITQDLPSADLAHDGRAHHFRLQQQRHGRALRHPAVRLEPAKPLPCPGKSSLRRFGVESELARQNFEEVPISSDLTGNAGDLGKHRCVLVVHRHLVEALYRPACAGEVVG